MEPWDFACGSPRYILTTTNPFAFTGKIVEKHGPDRYLVRQGSVTTCELPRPKWLFNAQRISVDVDSTAKIYHSDFRLMGMPVFYFPFVTLPVQKQERQSGFLIPSFGTSSTKGYIAGESVYWVFNRSMDATLGAEYYSKRAGFNGVYSELAQATPLTCISITKEYRIAASVIRHKTRAARTHVLWPSVFSERWRGVANVDYLSSFVFRIAFTDVYTQAIDSEVRSQNFLSNTTNGFHFNALAERYQNFEICDPFTQPHAPLQPRSRKPNWSGFCTRPSFFVSSEERQLGNTPLYWSFQSAAEGLQLRETNFRTDPLVGRFDLAPSVSMPLLWKGWSFRPELTLRDTFYTEQGNPENFHNPAADDDLIASRWRLPSKCVRRHCRGSSIIRGWDANGSM